MVVVLLRIDADDVLRDMFRAGKPNERDEPAFMSPGSAFVRKLLLRRLAISGWSSMNSSRWAEGSFHVYRTELHDCNKLL